MTNASKEIDDRVKEINKIMDVWVVWTNTDLTEGRGSQIPLVICETKETAIRLGKGKDVQGTDCAITQDVCFLFKHQRYVVGNIESPSIEDNKNQIKREIKEAAIMRAKAAGLTIKDIEELRQ